MTAQVHEVLILDGERTSMAFCPPLPKDHPRIFEPRPEEREVGPEGIDVYTTACWRGYIGTWEIKDGRLFLTRIEGRLRLRPGQPILASWFTGTLRVPRGKRLQYVHMGFGSVYEEELHIAIESGLVTGTRTLDNRGREHDRYKLGLQNLPGGENSFPGDGQT